MSRDFEALAQDLYDRAAAKVCTEERAPFETMRKMVEIFPVLAVADLKAELVLVTKTVGFLALMPGPPVGPRVAAIADFLRCIADAADAADTVTQVETMEATIAKTPAPVVRCCRCQRSARPLVKVEGFEVCEECKGEKP